MDKKIMVESTVDHTVVVHMPNSLVVKTWSQKGAKLSFNHDELVEAYFIPGIQYMFTNGILYTDDMDFKREVGLEPEEAQAPVNVIKLDNALIKRMIGPMPASQLAEDIKKFSNDQRQQIVNYIIDNPNDFKMDKVDIINKACNVNILKALELDKAAKEE